jgi:hypothetical protein
MGDEEGSGIPEIELIIRASTVDGRRKGACLFCQVQYLSPEPRHFGGIGATPLCGQIPVPVRRLMLNFKVTNSFINNSKQDFRYPYLR